MQTVFQDVFREARDCHEKMVTYCRQLGPTVETMADAQELADAAYALGEAEKLLDEARKRIAALSNVTEKMACLVTMQLTEGECIRTPYCTAIPMARVNAKVPSRKKEYEAWAQLMRHLGVPDRLLGSPEASPAVDVHWPGLMGLLASEQAEGQPLPEGVDPAKTVTEFSLTIRKKKGVTE